MRNVSYSSMSSQCQCYINNYVKFENKIKFHFTSISSLYTIKLTIKSTTTKLKSPPHKFHCSQLNSPSKSSCNNYHHKKLQRDKLNLTAFTIKITSLLLPPMQFITIITTNFSIHHQKHTSFIVNYQN